MVIKRGQIRITVGRDTDMFNLANEGDIKGGLKYSNDYLNRCFDRNQEFLIFRGKINHFSTFIESGFDHVLNKLNVPKVNKKTFRAKYYCIKKLINEGTLKVDNYNELLSDLNMLINERNKFAHGTITFFGEKMIIEYKKGSKSFEEEITENKIKELELLLEKCRTHTGLLIRLTNT